MDALGAEDNASSRAESIEGGEVDAPVVVVDEGQAEAAGVAVATAQVMKEGAEAVAAGELDPEDAAERAAQVAAVAAEDGVTVQGMAVADDTGTHIVVVADAGDGAGEDAKDLADEVPIETNVDSDQGLIADAPEAPFVPSEEGEIVPESTEAAVFEAAPLVEFEPAAPVKELAPAAVVEESSPLAFSAEPAPTAFSAEPAPAAKSVAREAPKTAAEVEEAKTASEAGVGGLLAMYKKKDDDAKEQLSLAELKRRRQSQVLPKGSDMSSAGASDVPQAAERADVIPVVAGSTDKVKDGEKTNDFPVKRSRSKKSRSSRKLNAGEPVVQTPALSEEELAKLREERAKQWETEKMDYEQAIKDREEVLKGWTKEVRVAESQQRVKDRRRIARAKKTTIAPDYVEADLYGRGFNGIFGEMGEQYTIYEAGLALERVRQKKAHVQPGEHVDYDLYGRADPRIFGEGAHLESKKQAAEASLKKQQEAQAKLKKNHLRFPVGVENYYRNYDTTDTKSAFFLRSDSEKFTERKANVYEAAEDTAEDIVANAIEFALDGVQDYVPIAEPTATASPTSVIPEAARAEKQDSEQLRKPSAAFVPMSSVDEEYKKKAAAEYATAKEDNTASDAKAANAFKDKFAMFAANADNDMAVLKKQISKQSSTDAGVVEEKKADVKKKKKAARAPVPVPA